MNIVTSSNTSNVCVSQHLMKCHQESEDLGFISTANSERFYSRHDTVDYKGW